MAGGMIAGGAALMVRELALPMILAMGGLALLGERWRGSGGLGRHRVATFCAFT